MSWQASRTDRFKSLFKVFACDLPYPQRVRLVFQLLDTNNRGRFRLKDLQEHFSIFAKELGVQFNGNTFATVDLFRAIDTRDEGSISLYELCMALIMHWEGRTLSGTKKLDYEQVAKGLLNEYSGSMTRHEVLQCVKSSEGPAEFCSAVAPFVVHMEKVLRARQMQEVLKLDGLLGVLKEAIEHACTELKQEANIAVTAESASDSTTQTRQPFAAAAASAAAAAAAAAAVAPSTSRINAVQSWNLERFRPKKGLLAAAAAAAVVSAAPGASSTQDASTSAAAGSADKPRSAKGDAHGVGIDLYGEDVMGGALDDLNQLARSTATTKGPGAPMKLTRQERNVMQLLHEQLTNAIHALTQTAENSLADEGSAATTTTSQQLLGPNQVKLSLSEFELARAVTHLQAENQRMKTRLQLLDSGGTEGLRIRSDTGFPSRDTFGLAPNSPASNSTVATEQNSRMLALLADVKHAFAQQASSRQSLGAMLLSQATLIGPSTESGAHNSTDSVSPDELKACIQEVKTKVHRLHRQKNKQQHSDAVNQATEATVAKLEEQLMLARTEAEHANLKLNDYDQLCIQVQVWKEKCHKLNARYLAEVTQLAAENETMARELTDKVSTIEAMQAHIAAAEALVVSAPGSIQSVAEDAFQAEASSNALVESLQQKLDQLNRQLQSALQEAVASKRIEQEREEQINDLQSLIEHLREENERLTADVEVANKSAVNEKELRMKVKQLEAQLAEAKDRLDAMLAAEHEMKQREQKANELIAVNARIQAEIEELKLENRTMMEAKVTATRLQQANDTLRGRVKTLESFKAQADEYKAKYNAAAHDMQVLQNQLEETPVLMGEVARLRGQLTALSSVLGQKNAEIEQLKKGAPPPPRPLPNDTNGVTPQANGLAALPALRVGLAAGAAGGLDAMAQQQQLQELKKANEELQQRNDELLKRVEQAQQQQQEIQALREQLGEAKRRNRTSLLKQAFIDNAIQRT